MCAMEISKIVIRTTPPFCTAHTQFLMEMELIMQQHNGAERLIMYSVNP